MNHHLLHLFKLGKVFFHKLGEDHVTAYSAMSAYFLLMSFVPFLMILLILSQYLPFSGNNVLQLLNTFSFIQENVFLQTILFEIFQQNNKNVLGITFFILLWTSSKSIWGFMKGLNAVYDIEQTKGNLLLRFTAVFYTIAFLFIITTALILFVFGNSIYQMFLSHYPFLETLGNLLFGIRSIFSFLILTGFFLLLYMHVPARKTSIRSQIIGAVFASVGWTVYSFFFSIYISYFSDYARLYGGLGTVLVFFLWLYMLMYILFLGAEINFFCSSQGKAFVSSKYY